MLAVIATVKSVSYYDEHTASFAYTPYESSSADGEEESDGAKISGYVMRGCRIDFHYLTHWQAEMLHVDESQLRCNRCILCNIDVSEVAVGAYTYVLDVFLTNHAVIQPCNAASKTLVCTPCLMCLYFGWMLFRPRRALLNVLIVLAIIVGMTFGLVLCYKYKWWRAMNAWLVLSTLMIMGYFTYEFLAELLWAHSIPMSWPTLVIIVWNFGVGMFCDLCGVVCALIDSWTLSLLLTPVSCSFRGLNLHTCAEYRWYVRNSLESTATHQPVLSRCGQCFDGVDSHQISPRLVRNVRCTHINLSNTHCVLSCDTVDIGISLCSTSSKKRMFTHERMQCIKCPKFRCRFT